MKNVHDIAKALAPKFNISVREAYYYADFIINTIHKKIVTQQYNALVIPFVGHIYLCRKKLKKRIDDCQERLNRLNSPEHFRNMEEALKKYNREKLTKEINSLTERYVTMTEYRNKQQVFYDNKIKRQLARRILSDQPVDTQKNGYASLIIDPLQRAVPVNPPKAKVKTFPMDTSPPDYL